MLIDRRTLLASTALLPLSSRVSSAAEDSSKTAFMKQAIEQLRKEQGEAPKGQPHTMQIVRVCIPVPFADFDFYYTSGLLMWAPNPGQTLGPVVVPNGFCTDLTSVPQAFWSVYPKTGKYAYAAIVHDYLYWTQATSRKEADDVLFTAMEDAKVSSATVWLIYGMVRAGGGWSWSSNAKAKRDGEKRLLKVFPADGQLISWAEWKSDRSRFSD